MVRLGDICEIQSGGTPARSKRDYWENGTIPWVKISDIKGKHLENTEEFIFTLAIPFDINSDGRFNALDYRSFTYYMLDKRKYALNYAQRAGADLNHKQGEKINVNALDYRQMTYAMLK